MDKNSEELIDQVNHVGLVGKKVESIVNSAQNMETSFERLERKIREPYDRAKPLHTASMNLHSTLVILRGTTRYLHLSRRLALQIAETNPQKQVIDPHALLRAAKTVAELCMSSIKTWMLIP